MGLDNWRAVGRESAVQMGAKGALSHEGLGVPAQSGELQSQWRVGRLGCPAGPGELGGPWRTGRALGCPTAEGRVRVGQSP